MSNFYDNLIVLCAECNKSPSGVAREIGLSNAAATGWKNGKQPSRVTLAKLSSYFDVPVEHLLADHILPEDIKKEPATVSGDKLIPGYDDLTEENKAKTREYIALLLNSQ